MLIAWDAGTLSKVEVGADAVAEARGGGEERVVPGAAVGGGSDPSLPPPM